MKIILSLFAVILLVVFSTLDAQGLILGHPLEFWDSADIILDGIVISTAKIEADNLVEHNIKVEQYFKNSKPQQMITVYGPDVSNEDWFYPKFFNKGERALFYLKKVDDKYLILEHSIAATEKCSPRDMIGLSTLPGEPIGRGGPTLFFDPYQTCNGYLYSAWYLTSSLTPIKQLKAGIKIQDIKCKEGLVLLLHPITETPACIKPQTEQKLTKRGWYYPVPFGDMTADSPKVLLEGFKDSYEINEPLSFIIAIKAGQKCGPIDVTTIDVNTSKTTGNAVIEPLCNSKYLIDDLEAGFEMGNGITPFRTDKTGSYKIVITFEGKSLLEKEFVVKESTK